MSLSRVFLGLAAGIFCSASPAAAILLEIKEGKQTVQVAGFLKDEDETTLRGIVRTPDGREQEKEFPLARVEVVHRLDVKRLERFSRDSAVAYRVYAEELARRKEDPEARETAMRLYLIAAKLEPDRFGRDSLDAMSKLARTPAEARKCRALAFLLDPTAGDKVRPPTPPPPDRARALALENFVRALQCYRAGRIDDAIKAAERPGVDRVFGQTPFEVDRYKFLQWCKDAYCPNPKCNKKGMVPCPTCGGRGRVPTPLGRRKCDKCNGTKVVRCTECGGWHVRQTLPDRPVNVLLQCELWALEQQAGGKAAADAKGWSAVLRSGRLEPVRGLSLDTAFLPALDPRKCLYRNHKWVAEPAP